MSPNQKAQSFINKMYNAKSGKNKPIYKRVYIQGQGKEYKLHLLSTEAIDPTESPFETVWLHSGYKHPNFPNQQYASTFRCLGGAAKCPLCADVKKIYAFEKENQIANKDKEGFKKAAKPYAIYWAENQQNKEISLVHVPKRGQYDDDVPAQEVLFNRIETFIKTTGEIPFDYRRGSVITITSTTVDKRDRFSVEIDPTPHSMTEKNYKLFETMPMLKNIYEPYSYHDLQCVADGVRIEYGSAQKKQDQSKKEEMQEHIDDVSNAEFSMDMDNEFAGSDSSPDDNLTEDERRLLGDNSVDTAFLEDDSFNLDPDADEGQDSLSKKLSKIDFSKSEE